MSDSKTKSTPSAQNIRLKARREEDAAATVAETQPQATVNPYEGFTPKQLKSVADKLEKAGDKAQASKLRRAADLAQQQTEQKKAEKSKKTESRDAVIAFVADALKAAFGSGKLAAPDAPFKVRISNEPPFAVNATGSRKEGTGDDRPSINAADLATAKVAEFLTLDGSPVTPATVNNKQQAAHPVAYLNEFAPDSVCYYDRPCRSGHADALREKGKLTDPQKQDINDGRGLRHGDAASRAFASLAAADHVNKVRLTDGSVITVEALVTGIFAAAPAA